ncbi:MAG: magnesium transporter [Thermoguttaceae bacterium]|jgi:magnesium transporter
MPDDSVAKKLNDPIAQHMRGGFASLLDDQTVGEALEMIRRQPPEGRIIYFYVLDGDGRLVGVVPTRRLLLNGPEKPIAEIMVREVIAVPQTATVLDGCEFFIMHRLLAFPVVDADRRMVGVIDVELYTAELGDIDRSERYDELFQLIGVHLSTAYRGTPLTAFRNRFPWLMCNIAGGILAAFIAGLFEGELQRVAALALFIPVVLAVAESISIQSLSLTLQLLRGQSPTLGTLLGKVRTEAATGLLLGIAAGIAVALAAWLWRGQYKIMLALLGGIAGGATCAAALGVAMPILLRVFRHDPRVAAGPIALALSDMITLLIYLHLARWLWM